MKSLVFLLLLICIANVAWSRPNEGLPIWLQDSMMFNQAQLQHIQTQQQLQQQDLNRRLSIMQGQDQQLQRILDQQRQMESLQHSKNIYDHSQRLRIYSGSLYKKGGQVVGKSAIKHPHNKQP